MMTVAVQLSDCDRRGVGLRPLIATHNLHQHQLFTDHALTALLDRLPREHLYALTIGTDPARSDDNQLTLKEGISGAEFVDLHRMLTLRL